MSIDFKRVEEPHRKNKDFILSKVSDAQIFAYYFGPFKFNEAYPSRFRPDRNPSTGFYISSSGNIIYNDMARNDENYDAFAFVGKLYNLNFSDTLKRIMTDFGLVTGKPQDPNAKAVLELKDFDKTFKEDTKIQFTPSKWTDSTLAFWEAYHITQQELEDSGIYVINDLYINEVKIRKNDSLRFALTKYVKGEMRTKVYSPGSVNFKWITNIPNTQPFGTEMLQKGDSIFISKAQKDRLIIKKFLRNVIATQNEKLHSLTDEAIAYLKRNFPKIYIGYDNDETGMDSMAKFAEKGFIPVHVPVEWGKEAGLKDFGDVAKEIGLDGVKHILKQNNVI